ncbi:MAG: SDR family NAD(P)-dependent oxidoreductase [Myxococcota bacterium]
MLEQRVAVVTGANRGLGLQTARMLVDLGWAVVITARGDQATPAVTSLEAERPDARLLAATLDVTDTDRARAMARDVQDRWGRVDALVNNAGAIFDDPSAATLDQDAAQVLRSLDTNAVGALRVTQALGSLLGANGGANVVNVSSGMGALNGMGGGHVGYRMSKAAMNAMTRVLHSELHGRGVRVNAVCPGWVRTDMGGSSASRSVEDGASGIVWAATLPTDGPSGGFFRDGQPIDW